MVPDTARQHIAMRSSAWYCRTSDFHHYCWADSLEEWLEAAKKGGHTAKLRQLLEQLRVAISRCSLAAPADLFVKLEHSYDRTHVRAHSLRAIAGGGTWSLPQGCSLSTVAHKLTKHEDARVAKAAAAVCAYWRTLSSVIPLVPTPPPAPAPVSNLRPKFFSTIFPDDVLALVLDWMSQQPQQPQQMICIGHVPFPLPLVCRVRQIARFRPVSKAFRDAADLLLEKKDSEEAKAVERAKYVAKEKRVAEAVAKARAELVEKEKVAQAIRDVKELANREAVRFDAKALVQGKTRVKVPNTRNLFQQVREEEAASRKAEEKARREEKLKSDAYRAKLLSIEYERWKRDFYRNLNQ